MKETDPRSVVDEMYREDEFSRFLGMEIDHVERGSCVLRMKIRNEMVNGLGIAHGGVAFSLADSALAFASNSHGRVCVALEASISYPAPVHIGDTLTATAEEISMTNRVGHYTIRVRNQEDKTVALFKGTVYRTSRPHGNKEESV